jgi:hypothetical protein
MRRKAEFSYRLPPPCRRIQSRAPLEAAIGTIPAKLGELSLRAEPLELKMLRARVFQGRSERSGPSAAARRWWNIISIRRRRSWVDVQTVLDRPAGIRFDFTDGQMLAAGGSI